MKITVTVIVQDAPTVPSIRRDIELQGAYAHSAAEGAKVAAAHLVAEAVAEFVEWQEEFLAPDEAAPVNPLPPVRPDRVVADGPEAWNALANLTRTPEAIHDAVAEEGSD